MNRGAAVHLMILLAPLLLSFSHDSVSLNLHLLSRWMPLAWEMDSEPVVDPLASEMLLLKAAVEDGAVEVGVSGAKVVAGDEAT